MHALTSEKDHKHKRNKAQNSYLSSKRQRKEVKKPKCKVILSNSHFFHLQVNMSSSQSLPYGNAYMTSQNLCSHCINLNVVPGCLVPGLAAAALECVSAPPAAAGCWPGSSSSVAPVAPLDVALHSPVLRTPSLAVGRQETRAS